MLHLYAITESRTAAAAGTLLGVDEQPVERVHRQGLTVFFSAHPALPLDPTPERLWQHEAVVEELGTYGPLLPLRFATCLPDEQGAIDLLEERCDALSENLRQVAGCVELGLRVLRLLEDARGAANPGGDGCPPLRDEEMNDPAFGVALRASTLQRRSLKLRDESLGELLHRHLARHAVEHQLFMDQGPGIVMRAAYLVPVHRLDRMRQAVWGLMNQHTHLHFLCTGPWPPYHFTPAIEALPEIR